MPTPTPPPMTDPAHDMLNVRPHPLDVFFKPRTVAVIGATERAGSVGRTLMQNLTGSDFGGQVFPVTPTRTSVLGHTAYPSLAALPDCPDLAIIATPPPTVPGVVAECVAAGVQGAVVITAGFKEIGPEGMALETRILAEAAKAAKDGNAPLRVIGPNCLGVLSPRSGLNATFAPTMPLPGNVAFLSQSGALLTAVLDYSLRERIGFSVCASLGSMLDVNWADLIDYLGNDAETESIIVYMETIGNARAFLSAAREVALSKPIVVIKAGRTDVGAKAAASHTGSLTGSDDVLNVAFARAGVLRVDSISDVFALTEALAKQPRPRGKRLAIVTNAGGPGVLATDALIGGGGELATLSAQTREELNHLLPPAWSHNNPIDVLGDADPDRYAETLKIAADNPESDGLLVILTPQAMTDPTETARKLVPYARSLGKPVIASWIGGGLVAEGERLLTDAGITTFSYPDEAARVFNHLWRYAENLRALYETPGLPDAKAAPVTIDRDTANAVISRATEQKRTLFTEYESKQLLKAYGIPTVPTHIAVTEEQAVEIASHIGYPVVLKLHSETVTHKSDVNGVHLSLRNQSAVRAAFVAIQEGVRLIENENGSKPFLGVTVQPMVRFEGYELILGASPDPQFGPILLFGAGGTLVEVFQDHGLGLPPLTSTLARRMMEQTRIYHALQGIRGRKPVNLLELEQVIVRFGQLIVDNPRIKEMDINPLLASPSGLVALDARVVLHNPLVPDADLPRTAIRPYPAQYASRARLKNGTSLVVRPIRPEDEPLLVKFHEALSENSVALRYFEPLALSQRVAHERLLRIAQSDYDREIALIALSNDKLIGIVRFSRHTGGMGVTTKEATFSLLISDEIQNQGLGTLLLSRLIEVARAEGIVRLRAEVLERNQPMQRICQKLGFTATAPHGDPATVTLEKAL